MTWKLLLCRGLCEKLTNIIVLESAYDSEGEMNEYMDYSRRLYRDLHKVGALLGVSEKRGNILRSI